MAKYWCVVEFSDGIQIVPQLWVKGDNKSYWPTTFKNSQKMFEKAVKEYRPPESSWQLHDIKILGIYDSYEMAFHKLKVAEVQSDLNTDCDEEEEKNSRSVRKRILPSSSEEEQDSDGDLTGIKPFPKIIRKSPVKDVQHSPSTSRTTIINSDVMSVDMNNNCCTCCCKFDKEYKKKLETDINEMKNLLKLILHIMREQDPHQATINTPVVEHSEEYNKLPMKTEEDVQMWERLLHNAQEEQKKLVQYLARIGGHDLNSIVKNILKRLFTDALASTYNWEGKKGKKMLFSLLLSDCIKKAAAASSPKNPTEQEVIMAVKNWLRHASARLGNSQKKNKENE